MGEKTKTDAICQVCQQGKQHWFLFHNRAIAKFYHDRCVCPSLCGCDHVVDNG